MTSFGEEGIRISFEEQAASFVPIYHVRLILSPAENEKRSVWRNFESIYSIAADKSGLTIVDIFFKDLYRLQFLKQLADPD